MEHQQRKHVSSVVLEEEKKKKVICIEGNIGAGKSTLIFDLKRKIPHAGFIEENLEEYTTYKQYNPLVEMYQNPIQNASIAQLHFIRSINNILVKKSRTHNILISDRSIYSPQVFGDALFKEGSISSFAKEYLFDEVISSAKNTLKQLNAEYVGMFFMNTPPTLCLERINGRNRNGEELITADYLENIEKSYQNLRGWWKNNICSPIEICDKTNRDDICEQFTRFMHHLL